MQQSSSERDNGGDRVSEVEEEGDAESAEGARASENETPHRSTLELADALGSEIHGLRQLLETLQSQRTAIATSDVDAINQNIFSMRRLLQTLGEARRYRKLLVERLGAPPDIAPLRGDSHDADREAHPSWSAAPIQQLRDEQRKLAAEVEREVETNRQILHGVIAAGEELIRVLIGFEVPLPGAAGSTRPTTAGHRAGQNQSGSEGALINRTI